MYDVKYLQKAILQLCTDKNLSVNKLADLSGITQSTIDSILKGKSKNPKIATLQKIANGFGMEFQRFLSYVDSMQDSDIGLPHYSYSIGVETEEDLRIVETISKNVKKLRKERNISLVQISEALHIDRFFEDTMPYHTLIALADYFDVSLDYLCGRSDTPERR